MSRSWRDRSHARVPPAIPTTQVRGRASGQAVAPAASDSLPFLPFLAHVSSVPDVQFKPICVETLPPLIFQSLSNFHFKKEAWQLPSSLVKCFFPSVLRPSLSHRALILPLLSLSNVNTQYWKQISWGSHPETEMNMHNCWYQRLNNQAGPRHADLNSWQSSLPQISLEKLQTKWVLEERASGRKNNFLIAKPLYLFISFHSWCSQGRQARVHPGKGQRVLWSTHMAMPIQPTSGQADLETWLEAGKPEAGCILLPCQL